MTLTILVRYRPVETPVARQTTHRGRRRQPEHGVGEEEVQFRGVRGSFHFSKHRIHLRVVDQQRQRLERGRELTGGLLRLHRLDVTAQHGVGINPVHHRQEGVSVQRLRENDAGDHRTGRFRNRAQRGARGTSREPSRGRFLDAAPAWSASRRFIAEFSGFAEKRLLEVPSDGERKT